MSPTASVGRWTAVFFIFPSKKDHTLSNVWSGPWLFPCDRCSPDKNIAQTKAEHKGTVVGRRATARIGRLFQENEKGCRTAVV